MIRLRELDHAAARRLTPGFRAGTESADFGAYEHDRIGRSIDVEPVRAFLDEAMARYARNKKGEVDAWLAPRLHYALRLTRREASTRGIWRWVGCVFAPDYVRWRHGNEAGEDESNPPNIDRFIGPDYKQAFARLWWMAELFRDGPDYRPVEIAMLNQDIPNNFFRMDIAHHRPTVQATVNVLTGKIGREANALAKAMNSTATTLLIDVLAPDQPLDPDAATRWVESIGDVDPVAHFDVLPEGPDDPQVPADSVTVMADLLTELLAEAPVRGR